MEAAKTRAQQLIDENAVMVFSKSYCPYCRNTKHILKKLNANFGLLELDQDGKFPSLLLPPLCDCLPNLELPCCTLSRKCAVRKRAMTQWEAQVAWQF